MEAKPGHGAATPGNVAQALREEMKKALSATRFALAAAVQEAKDAQKASLKVSVALVEKSNAELTQLISSQRLQDTASSESSTQSTPNMSALLSEQMDMAEKSMQAAQRDIEQTLAAASRVVADAMKYTAPPQKEATHKR